MKQLVVLGEWFLAGDRKGGGFCRVEWWGRGGRF